MRNQYQLQVFCVVMLLGFIRAYSCHGAAPVPSRSDAVPAMAKPNFVVIFCDDLGYGDVGCFGSDKNRTPCLDQMAREGARFTSFYVTSGVCSPSRSSLMTGCYPLRVGLDQSDRGCYVLVPGDRRGLNPDEVTIPEVLKTRGYVSACIGKWHLGDQPQFLPRQQGFDYYYGLPYSNDMNFSRGNRDTPPLPLMQNERILEAPVDQDTVTQRYTQEAVRFIREHKDQPFFLYLPHMMVHVPLHVGDAYRGRSPHGLYSDAVEEIDGSTQQIMATLRELNLDNKTLVIFTSDNGATRLGSNKPFSGGKATTREGGMRMPCVMRWPGKIPAGMVCDEVTSTIDLLPTLARLAGARVPTERVIDGRDIRDLMFNQPGAVSPHRDQGFFYYFMSQLQAVRSGRWKLCVRCDPVIQGFMGKPNGIQAEALYDLQDDPAETTNVADAHPEVVRRLNALADAARRDIGDYQIKGQGQRPYGYVADPITLRRSVSGTTTFGVIAYNIWQWGHLSPQDLAPIIKNSGATIVGLEESWNAPRNEELRDLLGWKTVLYGGKGAPQAAPPQGETAAFWINGYYMPQALVSPYEVLEHKYFNTINAKGYPDQGLPIHRGAVLAKLRLPSGEIVCVLVLHLMPWQNVEPQRLEEIQSILAQVRPYDQYPIIVMGDFNSRSHWDGATDAAAKVTQTMEQFGFQDAYRCVHPNAGRYPGQTSDGGSRIDYVFVNRHLIPLDCFPLQAGVFGSEGFADSDHLAVYAKLAIAPPSAEIDIDKTREQAGVRLFLLSGQSNMAGLDPNLSFAPTVKEAFAGEEVLVIKDAVSGQPIRRWYKQWKPEQGNEPAATGDLYDRLLQKVSAATQGKQIKSITFIWMQGERDARESHGTVYAVALRGLMQQLRTDLGRADVGFVIGRLSDFDMPNEKYPHWTLVRQAQVQVAQSDPLGAWVDTDDLNGPNNALHCTPEGYAEMGRRFARKAIEMLERR